MKRTRSTPLRHTELTRAYEAVMRDAKEVADAFGDPIWAFGRRGRIPKLIRSVVRLRKLEAKRG